MKHGLSDEQIIEIKKIFSQKPKVKEAILFGSRSLGTHKKTSDIDIALKGDIPYDMILKIKSILNEETFIPFFFDILDYKRINNKDLTKEIDEKGISFYKRDNILSPLQRGSRE